MALILDDTAFPNLALEAIRDRLILKLLTEQTDNAKAGVVKVGKLQDDPTTKKINILVHEGGVKWPDILDEKRFGSDQAHEIGGLGGSFWRRRFIVELDMFYENEQSADTARKKSQVAISRANHALSTMQTRSIPVDSFGEHAIAIQVLEMTMVAGGGEGDFNYRGDIVVEIFTEIEYVESKA